MKYKFILLPIISAWLTGCAALLEERSFVDEMDRESDGFFMAGRDFRVMGGDTGEAYRSREEIKQRTPASRREKKREAEADSIRAEYQERLSALGEADRAEFEKNQAYFGNDSERLYYLSMDKADKKHYLEMRRSENQNDEEMRADARAFLKKRSVHSAELNMGMTKSEIQRLWGKAAKIDYAGDPRFQNERWTFFEDGQTRYVYFEDGTVNGWSLDL